jgi:hypothetical protein
MGRHDGRPYVPRMHVLHGLRQAMVMLGASVAVALAGAGMWWAVQDGGLRVPFAVALMAIGEVLSLGGSSVFSRAETNDVRAFLGQDPDRDEPGTGESLTGVGVFLFVSLPLFAAGLLLYGSG